MKNVVIVLVSLFSAVSVFAAPGSHQLYCKSAANSGSKQVVSIQLSRYNVEGVVPPKLIVTLNGKAHVAEGEDDTQNWGKTFHHSPLGVITVEISNRDDDSVKDGPKGTFGLTAIPQTVKAYDEQGKLRKWKLSDEQNAEGCYDANGRATFQGVFEGYFDTQTQKYIEITPQIMDCEITYNSGSAC